jgi:hypothetical protein
MFAHLCFVRFSSVPFCSDNVSPSASSLLFSSLRFLSAHHTTPHHTTQLPLDSLSAFHTLYATASRARKTAATKLNAKSSRSHSLLTLKLTYKLTTTLSPAKVEHKLVCGKLHLVDLAGK